MNETHLDRLADLLLFAVGFDGGNLMVAFEEGGRPLALLIAAKAYKLGARYVDFEYVDHSLRAAACLAGYAEYTLPSFLGARAAEISGEGWKRIFIMTNAEMDAYENAPPESSAAFLRAWHASRKALTDAISSNAIAWTVTALPSPLMAARAFPQLDAAEALRRYSGAMVKILHLDDADPRVFWRAEMEKGTHRAHFLNSLNIRSLRFAGPGTDFTLSTAREARWIGGFDSTKNGGRFMANIPTDEIFTTPDTRTANGRVALTRPFEMHQSLGPRIENAWFVFKDGMVVEYGAEKGKETLTAFFTLDDRARYLGEVALVDPRSAIAQAGFSFHNGLYDENAACHIALGRSYGFTLRERREMTDGQLLAIGFNPCTVHEDMMIGGPGGDVEAVLDDGTVMPLIGGGEILF